MINAFALRVGARQRLTALCLLTVADIRGTSQVWNELEEYGCLRRPLPRARSRLNGADPGARIEERKRAALANHGAAWHLTLQNLVGHAGCGLASCTPQADEIAWHTAR
jgi:UTP:GlnB (protein PII) uridylyltransferase